MRKLREQLRCLFTHTHHRMRLASVLTPHDDHHLKLAAHALCPEQALMGRLFAYGYMRGLMQSVQSFVPAPC